MRIILFFLMEAILQHDSSHISSVWQKRCINRFCKHLALKHAIVLMIFWGIIQSCYVCWICVSVTSCHPPLLTGMRQQLHHNKALRFVQDPNNTNFSFHQLRCRSVNIAASMKVNVRNSSRYNTNTVKYWLTIFYILYYINIDIKLPFMIFSLSFIFV